MPKIIRNRLRKIEKSVGMKLSMIEVSAINITKWKWLGITQFSIKEKLLLYKEKKKFRDYR